MIGNTQIEQIALDRQQYIELNQTSAHDSTERATEYDQLLFAMARDRSERDVTAMPWLPQLPETWAVDLHDEIEAAERFFVAPNMLSDEYGDGTATIDDEIAEVHTAGEGNYLFSAEHATKTRRAADNKIGYPDAGTGGLVAVLAARHGHGLLMTGRQTGNAATDENHPLKERTVDFIPITEGYLSVHGMARGKFMHPTDRTEIHASIGLGSEPTESMHELAQKIVRRAKEDLGLYVVIGNDGKYFVQKEHSTDYKMNADGTPFRNQLAALKPNMMTNFVRRELQQQGRVAPSMQIELTKFLRLKPYDTDDRDRASRIIGTALGYKLLELATKLSVEEPPTAI